MQLSNWEITDKGLVIRCTKEESKDLIDEFNAHGYLQVEYDVLEHATSNGLHYVAPIEIGALTEATIVSDGENCYSDFHYYQIRSFVDDLINRQEAILHKITS